MIDVTDSPTAKAWLPGQICAAGFCRIGQGRRFCKPRPHFCCLKGGQCITGVNKNSYRKIHPFSGWIHTKMSFAQQVHHAALHLNRPQWPFFQRPPLASTLADRATLMTCMHRFTMMAAIKAAQKMARPFERRTPSFSYSAIASRPLPRHNPRKSISRTVCADSGQREAICGICF